MGQIKSQAHSTSRMSRSERPSVDPQPHLAYFSKYRTFCFLVAYKLGWLNDFDSQLTESCVGNLLSIGGSPTSSGFKKVVIEPKRRWYIPVKHSLDFVLALLLLIVLSPVVLISVVLMKLSSPGRSFYLQPRLGANRRVFRIIKLRTMIESGDSARGPVWASPDDPRITAVGRMLRKTGIDEIPSLVNVLLGDMSLVGPAPERPEIASNLAWEIERYDERTKVRPGITGLAQLKVGTPTDLQSVQSSLACDIYYILQIGPWMDFQLLIVATWKIASIFIGAAWRRINVLDGEKIEKVVSGLSLHYVEIEDTNCDKES